MLRFKVYTKGLPPIKSKFMKVGKDVECAVALRALSDTEPYVPARTLSMANRSQVLTGDSMEPLSNRAYKESKPLIKSGIPVIVYPGPYARFLYFGKLMVDPDTGSTWARKGVSKKVVDDQDLVFNKKTHSEACSHWFEVSKAYNRRKWERVAQKVVKDEL